MYILYLRDTSLMDLQETVNNFIDKGYRPFLPLVIKGESYIQPVILEEKTYIDVEYHQASAMFDVGSDV